MTREQKLDAIVAKIDSLLELASKRTPGEWEASDNVVCGLSIDGYYLATCDGQKTKTSEDPCNAQFIAACAGPAEAGWIATKAAIIINKKDALWHEPQFPHNNVIRQRPYNNEARCLDEIIAAWEGLV